MSTASATNASGWKIFAVGLEAYMALVTVVMVILSNISGGAVNVGALHHSTLAYLLLGAGVSFLALLPTGIMLFVRRQPKWGGIALAFAGFTLLFLMFFLPGLAKHK